MIGYLRGQVLEHVDGKMLVAVGDPKVSAVGYSVTVPLSASYLDFMPGRTVELFVHTHVREDAFDLYGFSSALEKQLFLTLLSVTGIGPKGAISMLSRVTPEQLIDAIVSGDKEALVQIPGIGKKTAERVVLELHDVLKKKMDTGIFPVRKSEGQGPVGHEVRLVREAKEALLGLGYRDSEIAPLLTRIWEEKHPEKVEDLIRAALQGLG